MEGEIRVLPPEVVRLIAAGEVIERPAAVVKELIENALDAGSSEVRVEVRNAGLSLIRVSDNGCGIPAAQVPLALQRHATSKINSVADLAAIRTLGFRGEALPSIAAVAELALVTQAVGEPVGTSALVRSGGIVACYPTARHPGTTATVRNLFRDVPARLKFLRDGHAETREMVAVMRRYVLAHPAVRFSLVVDGRPVVQTQGTGRPEDALSALYGVGTANLLLRLDSEGSTMVRGYISIPNLSRPDRRHLYLFVNGRPVVARRLFDALEAGYRPFFPRGRHPLAAIWLELPPEAVDVNVHPAKLEVRVADESRLCEHLAQAVRHALSRSRARPDETLDLAPAAFSLKPHAIAEQGSAYADRSAGLPALTVIGSTSAGLILAHGSDGIYLIDQHRAHERIIFNRLRAAPQAGAMEQRTLVEPIVLELRPQQAALLELRLAELAEAGFTCEHFGGRSFLIRAVPALAQEGALADVLTESLDGDEETWLERLLVALSCRSAVRKGSELTPAEQTALVTALTETEMPTVCPHGSPLLIHLPQSFLQRQFGW